MPKTNRKSGPHLIARLLSVVVQPHARFSYDPPSCASTVSGVAAVEHRTARAQASAMHLFLTLLTPSPEKIAAELVSVLGDATATFLSMSWTARYITWSALPTSAHSLPSLLQAALRICMYFFVGLCSALRLGAILDSNHFMQAGSSSISGDNNSLGHSMHASSASFATVTGTANVSGTGPKSGDVHRRPGIQTFLWMIILSLNLQPTQSVCIDARVGTSSTAVPEVTRPGLGTKLSGVQRASEPHPQMHLTRSGKRSYRRAYARACRMGGTPYKGRWRSWTWFEPRRIQPQFVGCRSAVMTPHPESWRTLTWNAEAGSRPTSSRSLKRLFGRCAMILSMCRRPNGDMIARGLIRTSIIFTVRAWVRMTGWQDC